MKHIFIMFLFSSFCFGQKVVVSNSAHNLLYLKSNPVDICVEGLKCSQFTVKVDNGEIKKENCNFIITPERTGTIKISVFKKDKLIAEKFMNVVELELTAQLNIPRDITTDKQLIDRANSIDIDAKQVHIGFNYALPIEYDVIIIRGDEVTFRNSYNDYVFNDELKNELNKAVENDLIIFTNMIIKFDDNYYYFNDKDYCRLNDIILKKD